MATTRPNAGGAESNEDEEFDGPDAPLEDYTTWHRYTALSHDRRCDRDCCYPDCPVRRKRREER